MLARAWLGAGGHQRLGALVSEPPACDACSVHTVRVLWHVLLAGIRSWSAR